MKHQLSHWKCVYYQMSLCSDLSEELVMGSRAKPEGGEMAPAAASWSCSSHACQKPTSVCWWTNEHQPAFLRSPWPMSSAEQGPGWSWAVNIQ